MRDESWAHNDALTLFNAPAVRHVGVTGALHELRESKFPFVSRIEFIRSKLPNFSAHVFGVIVSQLHDNGHSSESEKQQCIVTSGSAETDLFLDSRIYTRGQ